MRQACSALFARGTAGGVGKRRRGRFGLMWEMGSLTLNRSQLPLGRPTDRPTNSHGAAEYLLPNRPPTVVCGAGCVFLIEWRRSWGVALIHASRKFHLGNLRVVVVDDRRWRYSICLIDWQVGRFPLLFDAQSSVFAGDDWRKRPVEAPRVGCSSIACRTLFARGRQRIGRVDGESPMASRYARRSFRPSAPAGAGERGLSTVGGHSFDAFV